MPAVPRKSKVQSRAVKVALRFVWITSFILAVYGFVAGKAGFHSFLFCSLVAALGVGDIAPTNGIIRAIRLCLKTGK